MIRPTCAIDLDNVIGATHVLLHDTWRSLSPYPWNPSDYNPPGGEAELTTLLHHFHATLHQVPVYQTARLALTHLAQTHRILIITARPEHTRPGTVAWLTHHRIPYHTLYHTDEKADIPEPITFAVDDHPRHAEQYAAAGIPCYLLQRDWNQHVPPTATIRPVPHWEAILAARAGIPASTLPDGSPRRSASIYRETPRVSSLFLRV